MSGSKKTAENKESSLPLPGVNKCKYCQLTFKFPSTLKLHVDAVHEKKKEFKCKLCEKCFINDKLLRNHTENVHLKKKDLTCPNCKKSYHRSFIGVFNKHVETCLKSGKKILQCDHCEMRFASKPERQSHFQRFHSKRRPFKCQKCDKSFLRPAHLKNHVDAVHEKLKPYRCRNCNKGFVKDKVSRFKQHIANCQKKSQEKLECKKCDLKFPSKQALKNHVHDIHSGQKGKLCPICDKGFGRHNGSSLKNHILKCQQITVSGRESSTRFWPKCQVKLRRCEELDEFKLGDHQLSIECPDCGQDFPNRTEYKYHVKTAHDAKEKFKCDKCKQVFKRKHYLIQHIEVVHLNVTHYKCRNCGKDFHKNKTFHFRYHEENCQRLQEAEIKRQMRKNVKPSCILCLKQLANRTCLRRHVRAVHLKEAPTPEEPVSNEILDTDSDYSSFGANENFDDEAENQYEIVNEIDSPDEIGEVDDKSRIEMIPIPEHEKKFVTSVQEDIDVSQIKIELELS